jgi:hypothetical protein
MIKIVTGIFASYIITAVLVNGNIFYTAREWIKDKTPWLVKGPKYTGKHMLDCRMCVGFWVSLVVYLTLYFTYDLHPSFFFLIYGVPYFLSTQER